MLVGQLSGYDRAVEVGVGREPSVATALVARGADMVAVDVHDFPVPDDISFVRDDVFACADAADFSSYVVVEVVYALNISVKLRRPAAEIVRRADVDFLFTTLGYNEPSVPVPRESSPGETLHVTERGRRDQRARWDSPGRSQE